jgi:hypothetical protein
LVPNSCENIETTSSRILLASRVRTPQFCTERAGSSHAFSDAWPFRSSCCAPVRRRTFEQSGTRSRSGRAQIRAHCCSASSRGPKEFPNNFQRLQRPETMQLKTGNLFEYRPFAPIQPARQTCGLQISVQCLHRGRGRGEFVVLEDNLRPPPCVGYMLTNRCVMSIRELSNAR